MRRRELFWRNAWFVLRHAREDRRLRAGFFRLLFVVVYVVGLVAYEVHAFKEMGAWSMVWTGGLVALGGACAWWIRRGNDRADAGLLQLSVHAAPEAVVEMGDHRRGLVEELLRTAILCDRAGAEALHKEGKIAEAYRGVTRRRTLDLARLPGRWESLSGVERDLLMAAEGAWEWGEIGVYFGRAEDVRVLRWVLGLEEVLTPFEFLREDLLPVVRTTTRPGELEGEACLAPSDLRPARDVAHTMLVRCIAEGLRRGFYEEPDAERRRSLVEAAEELAASPGEDLYVGEVRVAAATQEVVGRMARAALRRERVLTGVIAYLGGPAEVGWRLEEAEPDSGAEDGVGEGEGAGGEGAVVGEAQVGAVGEGWGEGEAGAEQDGEEGELDGVDLAEGEEVGE